MSHRLCPKCRSLYTASVQHCAIDGTRLVDAETDPLVGQTVDRYQVLELLGVGAMGRVYRVSHTVLEQEHAMKVLFGDLGGNEEVVERFRREAKTISKIRHPNIVSVTDFGTTDNGLTFLVMELVRGRNLDVIIDEEGPLPPRRVANIARQIAMGLGAAHEAGFVHRDVKPSNVMVSEEGGEEYLKILDFGSVTMATAQLDGKLTTAGFVIGTPRYMAPEQARGVEQLTAQSDLYALGVAMFEMLMNEPPFDADAVVDVLMKHNLEPVPDILPSGGLEMLVRWLMEKRPEKRPGSAAEVVREIDRLAFSLEKKEQPQPVVDRAATTLVEFEEETSSIDLEMSEAQKEIKEALANLPEDATAPMDAVSAPPPPVPAKRRPAPPLAAPTTPAQKAASPPAPPIAPAQNLAQKPAAPPAPPPIPRSLTNTAEQTLPPPSRSGAKPEPARTPPRPPPLPHTNRAEASYASLRTWLDRLHADLLDRSSGDDEDRRLLTELMGRYEAMNAALRPGLLKHRYYDLRTKIEQLDQDLEHIPVGTITEPPEPRGQR